MRIILLFGTIFLLTGCLENGGATLASQPVQCFEISQEGKFSSQIMMNKCTGETWMLVQTALEESQKGKPTSFTYRWYPLTSEIEEPVMKRGPY